MDVWPVVVTERAALADLLETLAPEEWAVPSLCPGWSVEDVVAHLVSALAARPRDVASAFVAGRGRVPRVTAVLAERWADRDPAALVAALRSYAVSPPRGPASRPALTDVMVHRLDVAVPLGREVDRPVEPWRPVLDFLTSRVPMLGSIRGGRPRLAWRTTDLDWSAGRGPAVSGAAADVGLALAGRAARLDALAGPGVPLLRSWLS